MTNEIDISRRQQMLAKAQRDLIEMQNVTRAGEVAAVKAVRILMGSYPQTPPADPEIYMRQLVTLLAGAPLDDVHGLVDPHVGVITTHAFLPSIAEIHAWLDKRQVDNRSRMRSLRSEIETLTYDEGPTPPPKHIRDKQIAEWEAKRGQSEKERKAALEVKMDKRFKKQQRSVPAEGMQGLKNLDNMHPGSKG